MAEEIGFSDQSDSLLGKKWTDSNDKGVDIFESESVSDSKSEQGDKVVVKDDRSRSGTEVEALNVMCAEKDRNNYLNREKENFRGQTNDEELMGGFSNKESLTVKCGSVEKEINQMVVSEELADKKDTGADEIELGPISEHVGKNEDKKWGYVDNVDKGQVSKKSWAGILNESMNDAKGFTSSDCGEAFSEG
ncbi:hypothetical protein V6N13_126754 [Hibiscus sabdariffa]